MSLNFCQIPSPTTDLAAIERLKNECIISEHSSTLIFDWFLFILACNKNSYKSLDGFERTSDGGNGNHSVLLPIISLKNKVDQKCPSSYISLLLVSIL